MQAVAAEMNLSETAFVVQQDDQFSLRWFTPAVEVDLCGHATLATARALWDTYTCHVARPITFQTRSGALTARLDEEIAEKIWLNFPAKASHPVTAPDGLLSSLGLPGEVVSYVGRNVFDYLVEVADESLVRGMTPDFSGLMAVEARGVIVTAQAAERHHDSYDFVSRFFAPQSGINEDPVTGSAHCALAVYWAGRLKKNRMTGYQASRRGGFVEVILDGDRVHLGGRATVMMSGRLSRLACESNFVS